MRANLCSSSLFTSQTYIQLDHKRAPNPSRDESNRRTSSENPLQFLSFGIILLCERPCRKWGDFHNEMWSWQLIKQGPHIVATDAFSMSALPSNLTTLQVCHIFENKNKKWDKLDIS